MNNAIGLLLLLLQPSVTPDFVSMFTSLEYRYTGGGYRDELFRYRLFIPSLASESAKRPLIVWLHGNCDAHRDNTAHLQWLDQLIFAPPWVKDRFPFFALAVQCPRENASWTAGADPACDDMVNVVAAILEQTLQSYPVDRRRVYLVGVSSGGSGCWELATRHPSYFAAVAPLASRGGDNLLVRRMHHIPVWAFHSERDELPPIDHVRATVAALRSAGGKVHLTEIDTESHDCWTPAFVDYHLLEWLLAQRRGATALAPGSIPFGTRLQDLGREWEWWQVLAQIGIPSILFWIGYAFIRRRSSGTRNQQVTQ